LIALALAALVAFLPLPAPSGAGKAHAASAKTAQAPKRPLPKKLAPEENPKLGGTSRAFAKARIRFDAPGERAELAEGPVAVRLSIAGYALVGGAHAHVIVDNQPALQVDDASHPLVLENLAPGPHLLRAVLCRPWHEVVKAPKAFAMVRFWSGRKAAGREGKVAEWQAWPDPHRPLLTYVLPLGSPRPEDARFAAGHAAGATPVTPGKPAVAASTDPNLGGSNGVSAPPPPRDPPPPAPPPPAAPQKAPARRARPPALDFYVSHAGWTSDRSRSAWCWTARSCSWSKRGNRGACRGCTPAGTTSPSTCSTAWRSRCPAR